MTNRGTCAVSSFRPMSSPTCFRFLLHMGFIITACKFFFWNFVRQKEALVHSLVALKTYFTYRY